MVTYRCGSGREPRPESRLQATLRGCENDRLRINHTMRMPAKIGLKHDCLRLLFQRRCGVQLRQRSDGAIPSNLPPSLVAASSDKSSQSVSPHSRDRLAPHNDAPQIHFGQVSNSTSSHSRDALRPCFACAASSLHHRRLRTCTLMSRSIALTQVCVVRCKPPSCQRPWRVRASLTPANFRQRHCGSCPLLSPAKAAGNCRSGAV